MANEQENRGTIVQWRALLAMAVLIGLGTAVAGWLNPWSIFAFPLGTLVVALIVPIGLIAVAKIWAGSEATSDEL